MEMEILLFLVRENMLPMSLSCWRRGRGGRVLGVETQWHKAKREESR